MKWVDKYQEWREAMNGDKTSGLQINNAVG